MRLYWLWCIVMYMYIYSLAYLSFYSLSSLTLGWHNSGDLWGLVGHCCHHSYDQCNNTGRCVCWNSCCKSLLNAVIACACCCQTSVADWQSSINYACPSVDASAIKCPFRIGTLNNYDNYIDCTTSYKWMILNYEHDAWLSWLQVGHNINIMFCYSELYSEYNLKSWLLILESGSVGIDLKKRK